MKLTSNFLMMIGTFVGFGLLILFSLVDIIIMCQRSVDYFKPDYFATIVLAMIFCILGIVWFVLIMKLLTNIPKLVTFIVLGLITLYCFCVACFGCSLVNDLEHIIMDFELNYVDYWGCDYYDYCPYEHLRRYNIFNRKYDTYFKYVGDCRDRDFNCYSSPLNTAALLFGVPGIIISLALIVIYIYSFILGIKESEEHSSGKGFKHYSNNGDDHNNWNATNNNNNNDFGVPAQVDEKPPEPPVVYERAAEPSNKSDSSSSSKKNESTNKSKDESSRKIKDESSLKSKDESSRKIKDESSMKSKDESSKKSDSSDSDSSDQSDTQSSTKDSEI